MVLGELRERRTTAAAHGQADATEAEEHHAQVAGSGTAW